MNTASSIYSLGINDIAKAIMRLGNKITYLVEGDMGSGKSSIGKLLHKMLPGHRFFYFDVTTKEAGDVALPKVYEVDEQGFVRFVPNEELGAHMSGPVIVMLDELGKGSPPVKVALTRFMLERTIGTNELHPDSIVFATTNLSAENVGDQFAAHQMDRLTVVRMRKPTADEWIDYGINAGIHPSVLGFVRDNPHVLQSFTEVANPDENHYIYHPKAAGRRFFATPRSLEKASEIIHARDELGHSSTVASLIGTVGEVCAKDMATYIALGDKLPKRADILADPENAAVPESVPAMTMIVWRALSGMDREFIDPWMRYLARLPEDVQGMFVNGVRTNNYSKAHIVMTHPKFTEWCKSHGFLFTTDQ